MQNVIKCRNYFSLKFLKTFLTPTLAHYLNKKLDENLFVKLYFWGSIELIITLIRILSGIMCEKLTIGLRDQNFFQGKKLFFVKIFIV